MEQSALKESFLAAFDTYSDAIFRFCLVKTSNKELSEDLTQETFMRFWQALRDGKQMSNERSFLYTIANNLVIDWYRKKKSSSLDVLEEGGFEARDTDVTDPETHASVTQILAAVEDLEERDKEVILLRFVEGIEPKDIADILGETANAVSVRLNRALGKVKISLHV
jgi:RNA polymerase sigma factor (sigma-70 family)